MRPHPSCSFNRSRRLFAVLAGVTLAGGLSGCAGVGAKTGTYVDDSVITTKIKTAFASDKGVSALHLHVVTTNGHVTLTGLATSDAEKDRAGRIARSVTGVRSVSNDIAVGEP